MTIKETLNEATEKLRASSIEEARRDATLLLMCVTEKDRVFLLTHDEDTIDESVLKNYLTFIERRVSGEPLQHITRRQEFFKLEFEVTPDVLIPRPETEILVEAALEIIDTKITTDDGQRTTDKNQIRTPHSALYTPLVCDVGVGSGCIAISLLHERENLKAIGLDISTNALSVAMRNAIKHNVNERLTLIESDCFSALENENSTVWSDIHVSDPIYAPLKSCFSLIHPSSLIPHPLFDLIVSNPPYINEEDFQTLQSEVKSYEPQQALTPGGDGLSMIRRLLKDAPRFLKEGGYLIFEIGYDQSETVKEMIDEEVWTPIEIRKDLQGIPRTVVLRKIR
jgi:release factor glutamine methyltransferase